MKARNQVQGDDPTLNQYIQVLSGRGALKARSLARSPRVGIGTVSCFVVLGTTGFAFRVSRSSVVCLFVCLLPPKVVASTRFALPKCVLSKCSLVVARDPEGPRGATHSLPPHELVPVVLCCVLAPGTSWEVELVVFPTHPAKLVVAAGSHRAPVPKLSSQQSKATHCHCARVGSQQRRVLPSQRPTRPDPTLPPCFLGLGVLVHHCTRSRSKANLIVRRRCPSLPSRGQHLAPRPSLLRPQQTSRGRSGVVPLAIASLNEDLPYYD